MRRLISALLLVGLAWVVGLAAFIADLPKPSQGPLGESDGVVVYTGGGGARIAAAMSLLADGAGKRLLISGVNRGTSKERLSDLWPGAPEMFECCVDLGHEARSTEGNAAEAAQWALAHDFRKVILVTSDYHMPRAVAATKARLKEVEITPFVVASGYLDDKGRPISGEAWRRVAGEYGKYVLARVKAFFSFLNF